MKLIQQGAEAKIFLDKSNILKARTPKGYRHPQLDKQIRTRRTKSEAKLLTKALELGINVPKIMPNNMILHTIELEFIKGDRLSETLNSYPKKKQFKTMQKLGEQTALIHANNIIHGDLTTSNTIYKDDKVFIIDFGLGFISTKIEDKAVDLHLIKQALEAKHYQNHEELFKSFCEDYDWKDSKEIIKRLEVVEKRGRYKH